MNSCSRRKLFTYSAGLAAGLVFKPAASAQQSQEQEMEVSAVEDLMREHGILRRGLLIYTFAAGKLREHSNSISAPALKKTATLFRAFGEDYHERKLEEAFIFPAVKKAGGNAAPYADILKTQHDRGREITEYILRVSGGSFNKSNSESLAGVLEGFVVMYRHHAAREDTIVFPAWKKTMSQQKLDEMAEEFEEIEHRQFGRDGFDDAEHQMSEIEKELGLSDITRFTAPAPPADK